MRRAAALCVVGAALATASAAAASPPSVRVAAEPGKPLFGDAFDYVVTVDVDRDQANAVRIGDEVAPFTPVGATRSSRSEAGARARVTVTQSVACLSAACLPGPAGKAAALTPPRITVAGVAVPAPALSVPVGTRVEPEAVRAPKPVFRRPSSLPSLSTSVPLAPTGIALSIGGVVLILAGILGIVVPHRRNRASLGPVQGADPVARAIRLLRESEAREARDRRRAASLAARVVEEDDLVVEASRVAWSREAPGPPAAAVLADQVEDAAGARG